ncbi:DICT sensory domain-containing protein [Halalkalicoccus tibetensis]|uniref:DICT sensory domain-containing protein n=1 Tax=Halalkalicoccus tibetensis TaxID=175632 RepID=A0ABD5UZI1_9EURY
MSLTELISGVEAHEKTLTVYNTDGDTVGELRERFADRNLVVESGTVETGPDRFVVLGHEGEFLTAVGIDELLARSGSERAGFGGDPYRPILDHLDETLFTSYGHREMLAASREIEDRAWRVGRGELHAGFQRLSTLRTQLDVYNALARRDGLAIHTYAIPDVEAPQGADFSVHLDESDEVASVWCVAFDGGGTDRKKCALLAEERSPRAFYGFWTYDPDTVDYVIDHLSSTYARPDTG